MKKEQLIKLVEYLISGDWDDEEMEKNFDKISENVPCPFPEIQGYIFHSDGLTAEQMVQKMLNYKPTQF